MFYPLRALLRTTAVVVVATPTSSRPHRIQKRSLYNEASQNEVMRFDTNRPPSEHHPNWLPKEKIIGLGHCCLVYPLLLLHLQRRYIHIDIIAAIARTTGKQKSLEKAILRENK